MQKKTLPGLGRTMTFQAKDAAAQAVAISLFAAKAGILTGLKITDGGVMTLSTDPNYRDVRNERTVAVAKYHRFGNDVVMTVAYIGDTPTNDELLGLVENAKMVAGPKGSDNDEFATLIAFDPKAVKRKTYWASKGEIVEIPTVLDIQQDNVNVVLLGNNRAAIIRDQQFQAALAAGNFKAISGLIDGGEIDLNGLEPLVIIPSGNSPEVKILTSFEVILTFNASGRQTGELQVDENLQLSIPGLIGHHGQRDWSRQLTLGYSGNRPQVRDFATTV